MTFPSYTAADEYRKKHLPGAYIVPSNEATLRWTLVVLP